MSKKIKIQSLLSNRDVKFKFQFMTSVNDNILNSLIFMLSEFMYECQIVKDDIHY